MATICSQTRLNPVYIKSWRAGGQSSYWHFCCHIMTEDPPAIRNVPSEMDCRSCVSLCCGSWWCDLYAWLCLQTVAPGCCLSLCSTVWKKKLHGLLCERDVASMYIYTSSVSRLLRGYHALVVYCKLLELLQNLSSSSSNDKTELQIFCLFHFLDNPFCHKGIGSCAGLHNHKYSDPSVEYCFCSSSVVRHWMYRCGVLLTNVLCVCLMS